MVTSTRKKYSNNYRKKSENVKNKYTKHRGGKLYNSNNMLFTIISIIILTIVGLFLFKKYIFTENLALTGINATGIPNKAAMAPHTTDYDTRSMSHGAGAGFTKFRKYSNPNKWIFGDDGSGTLISKQARETNEKFRNLQIPTIPPAAINPMKWSTDNNTTLIDQMSQIPIFKEEKYNGNYEHVKRDTSHIIFDSIEKKLDQEHDKSHKKRHIKSIKKPILKTIKSLKTPILKTNKSLKKK